MMKNYKNFFLAGLNNVLPLIAMLVLAIGMQNAIAQPQYYNTFAASTGNSFPLSSATNKIQYIYGPNLFYTGGTGVGTPVASGNLITKVYFKMIGYSATTTYTNFTISLGQNVGSISSYPQAPATTGVSFNTGLTQCFFQASGYQLTGGAANSWYGITLQTPFAYDPSLALIFELKCSNTGATNTIGNTSVTGVSHRLYAASTATTGTANTGLVNFGIDVISGSVCSNPISTPGTSTATPSTPICIGTSVGLNVSGGPSGSGLTYQWFSDPAIGGSYSTPVSGVLSSPLFNITPSTTLYYRCQEICSAGTPANSTPVLVTINPPFPGGTYTINSAVATGGTNFQTFGAAVAAISCGISGPVIFNVDAASGPYTEQISIPSIGGASATNTVTFNGNGRTLQFASADANNRHVVKLDGADYITFDNLKIVANTGTYGWGFHLINGADRNTISNCAVTVAATEASPAVGVFHCIVLSNSPSSPTTSGNNGNFNTIINDTLIGGYYTAVLYGNSAASAENLNNKVLNCVMKDSYSYTLYMAYQKNDTISGNDFSRPTRNTSTTTAAVFLTTGNVNTLVEKNRVHNYFDAIQTNTSTCYSFYVAADGTAAMPNRYINNLVYQMGGNGTLYGIYNTTAPYMIAYHNTIAHDYTASTAGLTYGFYQTGVTTGLEYRNNNIYITRGGTGAKVGINFASASTITSNNNNIYLASAGSGTQNVGNYTGTNFATIGNWQTANGNAYDQQSISVDPVFVSPGTGNYTPSSLIADNLGVNLGVTTDILGAARSVTTPDAGAFEFTVSAGLDVGAFALVTPATTGCYSNLQQVVIRIKNYGGVVDFSVTPVTITCNITGAGTATLTGTPTGTLAINGTMDVLLSGTFDMSANGAYTFNAFTTAAGDVNASNDAMTPASRTRAGIVAGSVSSNFTSYCLSGSPVLTLTGSSGGDVQWQQSVTGASGPWTNVGAGTSTYAPGTITQTTYFRALVSCILASDSTNVVADTIVSPSVTSTNSPVSLCGTGTVVLNATASGGAVLNWYTAATGGSPVGTGPSFTTPTISSPTSYYVSAITGSAPFNATVGTQTTTTQAGMPFRAGNGTAFRTQYLYTAAELSTAGINAGSWNQFKWTVTTAIGAGSTMGNLTIRVGHTGVSALTSAMQTSPSTVVYGPVNYVATAALGDITFNFTTPFSWDGSSNVLIEICHDNPAPTGVSGQVAANTTSFVSVSAVGNVCATATGGTTQSIRPIIKIAGGSGCESNPRTQVVINQTNGPAITATHTQTVICSGGTDTLKVSSANPGYKYTWTPGALTGPSVTVNPVGTTIYTVTALDTTTGTFATCVATATVTVTTQPAVITVNATPGSICGSSGSVSLSLTPAPTSGGIVQWQDSPNDTTYTDIPAANGNTYITPVLTATRYYRALIKDAANNICIQPKKVVAVGVPVVTSTTPDTICGTASAILSATGSVGATLNWYTTLTGGSPIGTGSPFTTPVISNTTTYYVSASNGNGGVVSLGMPNRINLTANTNNNTGLVFATAGGGVLNSVSVYPSGTGPGTLKILLKVGPSGAHLDSVTVNLTGVAIAGAPKTVIPLNFVVPPGSNYYLSAETFSGGLTGLGRETAGATFPYTAAGTDFTLTGSWLTTSAPVTNTHYYYFYDWKVSAACESPRSAVLATVNPGPPIDASSLSPAICPGGSTSISVSSINDPVFDYTWTSNPPGFTASGAGPFTVSPSVTTTYIVTALDNSGGPNTGCGAIDSVTVTTGAIAVGTISASPNSLCVSGTPVITSVGSAGLRQWQQTNDTISGPWINVGTGGTSFTPSSPITQKTYYRLRVSCDVTILTSNIATVLVSSPAIISSVSDTACGVGSVTLQATGSPGTNLKWYATPSGGSPLGTGNSYTTPVISTTTNYYVEPTEGTGGADSLAVPLASGTTTGVYHHMFLVSSPTGLTATGFGIKCNNVIGTLTSWDIYYRPDNYQLVPGSNLSSAGWTLLSSVTNVPSLGATDYTFISLPISIVIPPATTYSFYIAPVSGTHQYGTSAAGTVVTSNLYASIIAGHRGSTLFNCNTASGFPVVKLKYSLGCTGIRVPVAAVITSPPAINVLAADPAVCAAGSTTVQVSSSNDPNYTYTWTSIPPGYTNTGSGPFTVSPTVTTTYLVSATDASAGPNNGCIASGSATVVTGPALIAGTASSTNLAFCVSGTPTLSLDGSAGGVVQWQQSVVSAAGPWSNAVLSPTYSPFLTQTTHFRAIVKCPGDSVISNVVTVLVTTPLVTGTTPDTRCGYGPVTLTASGSGSQLNWYNQATGGTLMNTGSPFTTTVTGTDTFYVATQQNPFDTISPGFTGGTTATDPVAAGNMFNVHTFTELTINGFDINLNDVSTLAPSNISVYYKVGSYIGFTTTPGAWTLVGSVSGITSAGFGVPTNLPLAVNLTIPAGQTYGFYIVVTNLGVANSLVYNSSATSPAEGAVAVSNAHLEVIAGTTVFGPFTGLPAAPTNRMWNGRVRYSIGCESSRVPVIATVTNPPALTLSSGSFVCSNVVATLSVTSNLSNYNSYTWSPFTNLFQDLACTLPYTGQNLSTVYLKSNSPVDTTSYTCIANNTVSLCGNIAHTDIVVNGIPNVIATASAASVCPGVQDTLSVTVGGSSGSNQNIGLTATVTSSGGGASASGYGPELLNNDLIPACDIGSVTFNWGWVTTNGWYLYTWPTVQTIKKVVFFKSNRPFTSLNIESSVDGITFTPVVTGVLGTATCAAGIVYSSVDSVILATPITTRFLRFNNIAGTNPNFREIQVYPPSTGPGLSFTWNPGSLSGNKVVVTPSLGLNTYIVTVYDSTSQCTTYDTVTVNGLTIPATPVATPSVQCGYGVPTASVSSGSGSFQWYLTPTGGTPIPGESGTTLASYAINSSTTFYVSEFNGACSSNRATVQANVVQPDVITASSASIPCANSNLTLQAAQSGSTNIYSSYVWSATPAAGSGIPATVTGNPKVIQPTANGTYVYTVMAFDTVSNCVSIDTMTVNVAAAPAISSVQATPGLICGNSSPVTLTALTGASVPGFANIGTQTTTIGGNNGNPYRTGNGVGNQVRTQLLVLASELTAAGLSTGNITSLGFTTTGAAGTVVNFTVKIGHTAASTLTTSFITTSMTTVFTQATFSPAVGLNTHVFSTPFAWDGISNIIIDVCQQNSVTGTTTVAAYTPGNSSNLHVGAVGGCSAATGTIVTTKPIMRFGGQVGGGLGAGTYGWQWSPGSLPAGNVANATPPSTTTYTVTATDPASGCTMTATAGVIVTALPVPYVYPHDSILCTGELISIVARDSATYGAGWPTGTSFDFGFGPTTDSTFLVNGPGNYNVQVILPLVLGGCSQISSMANIVYNDSPVLFAATDSVNCFGTSTGYVSAQVFLGTPPYRYKYYNGVGAVIRDTVTNATNDTLFNLPAGNYCIVVRDAINAPYPTPSCRTDSVCVIVDEPMLLTASETHGVIACNGNTTPVNITAAGGTPPYTGTGTFTQGAGSQVYTVTDANGCTAAVTVNITQPAVLTVSVGAVNIPCAYVAVNVISTVAGGTPSYEYLWSNSAITPNLSAVGAGTYTLTVTDLHGCSATASTTAAPPGPLALATIPVMPVCRGAATGSITLSVTGGMSAFTYLWNGGNTNQNRTGLAAGTYTVTVTDINGCTKTKTTVITQPATTLVINSSQTNVRCYGLATGVATVAPAGGSTPYSYSWNTVPVKTTASVTGLTSGVYSCSVTDAIGCTKTLVVTITQPTDITVFQTQTNVTFPGGNNGSATVSVSGGTPGYTYSWNTIPVSTTASVTGLTAGTYKCTITDTKSCTKKVTFIITEPIAKPGDSPDASLDIRAYPNPTSGVVMLSFNNLSEERFSVRVSDLTGRMLFEEEKTAGKGLNEFMYDFTSFSKGVYFINVSAGDRSKVIRIIIE